MRLRILVWIGGMAIPLLPTTGSTQYQPPRGGGFGGQSTGGFGGGGVERRGSMGGRWVGSVAGSPGQADLAEEEQKKPTVYHANNLPKEVPSWFRQLDTDGDAQIGLYEWKTSGRSIKEFQRMDRNGDGFLTVDEVLYYVAKTGFPPAETRAMTGGPGMPGGPFAGLTPGGAPASDRAELADKRTESMFRRMDRNGDGLLNYDEMPETLRAERDKWDTNKDGFIDLSEFKAYYAARMQQFQPDRSGQRVGSFAGSPGQADLAEEEQKKPTVYRADNLPKELPSWFRQLDTDGDAQIGLYEWKTSGRSIKEFQRMDRNGDGFLTVDEVLYYMAKTASPAAGGPGLIGGPGMVASRSNRGGAGPGGGGRGGGAPGGFSPPNGSDGSAMPGWPIRGGPPSDGGGAFGEGKGKKKSS